MRVFLDANIFISYLLAPQNEGPITSIVDAAFSGAFTLVVSDSLLEEFSRKVATKPYLSERIATEAVEALVAALLATADRVSPMAEELPTVVRDPKDDYLIAYALLGRADCLVTGDKDLLALAEEMAPLRIVSPAVFAREIA